MLLERDPCRALWLFPSVPLQILRIVWNTIRELFVSVRVCVCVWSGGTMPSFCSELWTEIRSCNLIRLHMATQYTVSNAVSMLFVPHTLTDRESIACGTGYYMYVSIKMFDLLLLIIFLYNNFGFRAQNIIIFGNHLYGSHTVGTATVMWRANFLFWTIYEIRPRPINGFDKVDSICSGKVRRLAWNW